MGSVACAFHVMYNSHMSVPNAMVARRALEMTKARAEELKRLLQERQATFGASRTRVQNTLVGAGMARYLDDAGQPVRRSDMARECEITPLGRAVIVEHCAAGPTATANVGRIIEAMARPPTLVDECACGGYVAGIHRGRKEGRVEALRECLALAEGSFCEVRIAELLTALD